MAIFKNGELVNKKTSESNSAATLLTSDISLNKTIEDYITACAKYATLYEVIYNICITDTYDSNKIKLIKAVLQVDEDFIEAE